MANVLQQVDERTKLAGTNKLEVLLFSLGVDERTGRDEVFGINVFKVREVMKVPDITHAPDMPPGVEGMISLRGSMIPVLNLGHFCNMQVSHKPKVLMVTEYNRTIQGFLVQSVDHILRLEWGQLKSPPSLMSHQLGGLITAVCEIPDGRIVMVLDVEKLLSAAVGDDGGGEDLSEVVRSKEPGMVVFADDSSVARKRISALLDQMGVKYISANNGAEAWQKLQDLAERAIANNAVLTDQISVVLTDVEMPEMDGYVLTMKIKQDPRFKGIPVVMHSSLSAATNVAMGKRIGADGYVAKFDPMELSKSLTPFLELDKKTKAAL
ncbi:MAG: chemotaxis protein CheV [Gammaproteobacteria bacterium]|nr:chemotaxis protein CheV [Gammaproteobacteria bacterium]